MRRQGAGAVLLHGVHDAVADDGGRFCDGTRV